MAEEIPHLGRLKRAIKRSREQMEVFEERRVEALRHFVGHWYSEGGSSLEIPINMVSWTAQTYLRLLTAREPRTMITTVHKGQKRFAEHLRLGMDYWTRKSQFGLTMRKIVEDGLFGPGIAKVGICDAFLKGFTEESGQPFVDRISPADFFFDHQAREFEECQFVGDVFRVPVDAILERGNDFSKEVVERIESESTWRSTPDRPVSELSRTVMLDEDRYMQMVTLWDVWIPREGVVVTLVGQDVDNDWQPLRIREWDGPEYGPYHLLRYMLVPDQIMPLSPLSQLMDLQVVINSIARKLNDQAEREKENVVMPKEATRDAEALQSARDGDVLALNSIKPNQGQIENVRTGGINNVLASYMMGLISYFKQIAGGLDSLAGTGPMSDTAAQDRMIMQSASQQIADLQDKTVSFAKEVLEDVAFWMTRQGGIDIPIKRKEAGIEFAARYQSDDWEEAMDYDLEISPYSMGNQSPAQRLGMIRQVFNELIAPMAPMMAQQGLAPDIKGLLSLWGRYADMEDDLSEIIQGQEPTVQQQDGPQMPQQTKRTYERVNRPGASVQGQDQVMQRMMAGGNGGVQNSEAESLGRPAL